MRVAFPEIATCAVAARADQPSPAANVWNVLPPGALVSHSLSLWRRVVFLSWSPRPGVPGNSGVSNQRKDYPPGDLFWRINK